MVFDKNSRQVLCIDTGDMTLIGEKRNVYTYWPDWPCNNSTYEDKLKIELNDPKNPAYVTKDTDRLGINNAINYYYYSKY